MTHKVLILVNDVAHGHVFGEWLRLAGYHTVMVCNDREQLNSVMDCFEPDLILADCEMFRRLDGGIKLVRELLPVLTGQKPSLIFMCSHNEQKNSLAGFVGIKCAHFVKDPVKATLLLNDALTELGFPPIT